MHTKFSWMSEEELLAAAGSDTATEMERELADRLGQALDLLTELENEMGLTHLALSGVGGTA